MYGLESVFRFSFLLIAVYSTRVAPGDFLVPGDHAEYVGLERPWIWTQTRSEELAWLRLAARPAL